MDPYLFLKLDSENAAPKNKLYKFPNKLNYDDKIKHTQVYKILKPRKILNYQFTNKKS